MGMLASKSAGAATLIRLPCATEEAQMKQVAQALPHDVQGSDGETMTPEVPPSPSDDALHDVLSVRRSWS